MVGGLRSRREQEESWDFVTGYRLRERLAVPVAETRDVQTLSWGMHRCGPDKPL